MPAAAAARRRQRPVNPDVLAAWEAVKEDLAENFVQVEQGRIELMGGVQMKKGTEDGSAPSIYRMKYDLLGKSVTGQEAYLKATRRTVKVAKEKESVKKLMDMMKNGYGKLDRREMVRETEKLARSSKEAATFFTEIMPGVMEDPVADTINGLVATVAIIIGVLLVLCCFFAANPPPPEE